MSKKEKMREEGFAENAAFRMAPKKNGEKLVFNRNSNRAKTMTIWKDGFINKNKLIER